MKVESNTVDASTNALPFAKRMLGEVISVRVTQLDGDFVNLACMQIIAKHKELGHNVILSKSEHKSLFEPEFVL